MNVHKSINIFELEAYQVRKYLLHISYIKKKKKTNEKSEKQ